MTKIKLLTNVDHDGKFITTGSTVDFTDEKVAKRLVENGAAEYDNGEQVVIGEQPVDPNQTQEQQVADEFNTQQPQPVVQ